MSMTKYASEPFDKAEVWSTLGLYFATTQEREQWRRVYFLDTTPDFFLQWLEDRVEGDRQRLHPVGKVQSGEIFITSLQVARNGVLRMWIHALCEQRIPQQRGPDQINTLKIGSVIHFKVLAVSNDRVKLETSCLTPCVTQYYGSLLGEIGVGWPEANVTEKQTKRLYRLPALQRPRAPKRKANARRDAEIYDLFMEGSTHQDLSRQFHVTTYRIKQIIREQRDMREQQAG